MMKTPFMTAHQRIGDQAIDYIKAYMDMHGFQYMSRYPASRYKGHMINWSQDTVDAWVTLLKVTLPNNNTPHRLLKLTINRNGEHEVVLRHDSPDSILEEFLLEELMAEDYMFAIRVADELVKMQIERKEIDDNET